MEVSSTTKENSKVLQGVCAYVEVRSKYENRSNVIAEELRKLGAQISDKLNVNATHVVFKDGTNRTWERAKKLDIPVVSVLWVDGCKKTLERISERAFPAESPIQDESMRLFPAKRAKFRSMQPKDLTEEFEDSSQRCHRRRKRTDKNKTPLSSSYNEPAPSPLSPCSFDLVPHIITPPSMKAKLLERSRLEETKGSSSADEDIDNLKRKLFNGAKNTSPDIFPDTSAHSPHTSPRPDGRNFSEMLPPNLLSDIPSRKKRSKSFGIPSDVKPSSKTKRRKSMKVNEQTISQDLSQQTLPASKQNRVCDSTGHHPLTSSTPLSAISGNTCNMSMDDFITNRHVQRKKYKRRETLNILGVTDSNLCVLKNSLDNSDQNETTDMSKAKCTKTITHIPHVLPSPEVVERTVYNKNLEEDGAPYCSTPADKESGRTQSNVEERLQQQFEKTDNITHDNLSQSSSQSTAYSVCQASSLLLPPGSQDQSQNISTVKEKKSVSIIQKPIRKYLVMTSLCLSEQEMVKSIAKALSGSVISDHVRKSTTHVICGNSRRTLNLLYGMTQGCWLVSKQWVVKSMEAGKWVDERKFEMTDDYPAAKIYRQNKQKNCSLPIFQNCGPMFISTSTAPPRKDLVHFVQFCGGQVKMNMCDADFYVGDEYNPAMLSVSPQWILDSVTEQKALPFEMYQLGQPKPPSPEY